MRLTEEEQGMLAGQMGAARQQALQHQLKVGDFFGAEDFVPVSQAHVMADSESLGEAGIAWLEQLARLPLEDRTVRIPTITDPRGIDFSQAATLRQAAWMLHLEKRLADALRGI